MAYITETEYKQLFSVTQFAHYIQGTLGTASEASARFNMLNRRATNRINNIINMRYDTTDISDIPETLKFSAGALINYYAVLTLGQAKDADVQLYNNTIEELKEFRDNTTQLTDSNGDIIDEYFSKRVWSAGGNTKSAEEVDHINKYL